MKQNCNITFFNEVSLCPCLFLIARVCILDRFILLVPDCTIKVHPPTNNAKHLKNISYDLLCSYFLPDPTVISVGV